MLKTVVSYLLTQLPDTVKIVIATLIIALLAVIYTRAFQIHEIRAYVDPIQSANDLKFQAILLHSENSFRLLSDDLKTVKEQNTRLIERYNSK